MKKILLSLLSVVCLLMVSIGLTACGGVECKVNFVVDENVYDTVATNGNEAIKLPSNPVKDGYEFEGWYWDDGKWEKPFTVNSLLNTPLAADMNVYAKFTHNEHCFDKEIVVNPTCTEKGYTLKECECGETTKTNYVLTVEHTFSDFEIRTEATTYSVGLKERICTVCGFVDKELIPKVSVSFGVTVIEPYNPNLYIGEIDFPSTTITQYTVPDSFSTEIDVEQKTIIVKAEDLPKDIYDDLKDIVIDTFPKDSSDIVIGDVKIENIEDFIIYIEDENGELVPVPWTNEEN